MRHCRYRHISSVLTCFIPSMLFRLFPFRQRRQWSKRRGCLEVHIPIHCIHSDEHITWKWMPWSLGRLLYPTNRGRTFHLHMMCSWECVFRSSTADIEVETNKFQRWCVAECPVAGGMFGPHMTNGLPTWSTWICFTHQTQMNSHQVPVHGLGVPG